MKKTNVYGALLMSFMAGMALLSGHEHNVSIAVVSMVMTVFVANNWGFAQVDDERKEVIEKHEDNKERGVI